MNAITVNVMGIAAGVVLSLLVVARPVASPEQDTPTIASVMDEAVSSVERRLVGVAEPMPEEKYGFVPTSGEFKDVMSFGDQVKHIADDNYGGYSLALDEKAPADSRTTQITGKADILGYLRGSFALAHRAAAALTAENIVAPVPRPKGGAPLTRLAIVVEELRHEENHYGQLVEYLRMNGIIPPASRPQTK